MACRSIIYHQLYDIPLLKVAVIIILSHKHFKYFLTIKQQEEQQRDPVDFTTLADYFRALTLQDNP